MKNVNKKVLKVVERLMRNEAVQSAGKFPPPCLGIFHQPKCPINQKKKWLEVDNEKYKSTEVQEWRYC